MSSTSPVKLSPSRWILLSMLALLAIAAKVMPYVFYRLDWNLDPTQFGSYVWNFSPLMPLAIVAGASLSRKLAIGLTMGVWLLGDLGIWTASGHFEWAFYPHQPLIYVLALGLIGLGAIGSRLQKSDSYLESVAFNLGSGVIGATLFFVVTNVLVWGLGSEMLYTRNLAGLTECFVQAIPFYRNSLASMIIFVPVLTAILSGVPRLSESPTESSRMAVPRSESRV
ncbi:DUF6580 family putative transport protein [Rubinisphaera margarita]|uniref:DUF6580 family putative transport protein n=1 Tax=Rubinisphaera margarita TaxID=2909586 RepID=UPI001EE99B20|nr:DUF6580 family putative transport protein [Rubinisphaera margarita]MCG6157227.1 hypothetical protein [Rubinisphaera margarita]